MTLVLDGPMGTELIRRGVPAPGRSWSAAALDLGPDVVAAVHREYASAGATVHRANTFRTTRRAVGERWAELARRAVRLARCSVPFGHTVAGSIAPLEDCYRPDLSPGEAGEPEHEEVARALADAGADLLVCETFPSGAEAAAAVRAAVRTGVTTWVALTAGPTAELMTPAMMAVAARACADAGASAVLVNCTPATHTLAYLRAIAEVCPSFGAYANAGAESDGIGWGAPGGPLAYAGLAREWIAAGASIVGACCGTGPAHVAAVADVIRSGRPSLRAGRAPSS